MRKLYPCFFAVLLFAAKANAQDVAALLNEYNNKVPQEKLYIQFDQSVYTPGQTIYFKAYLQKGNRPSFLSTNLYMDWYDDRGKLVTHTTAPVIKATAHGNITVPESMSGNRLRLVAYTKWMLNFDSSFLFHKIFPVVRKAETARRITPGAVTPVTTLRFFPEGGDLVEGVTGKVAFKALNALGLPARVNGIVMDGDKKQVAEFSILHEGMGWFSIKPEPGKIYTAQWKDADGVSYSTTLPVAKKSGVMLSVLNTAITRSVSIERNASAEARFKKVTLVASMNQEVLFKGSANLSGENKVVTEIPTERFPSGVLRLTAFDADMVAVAERVLFINNDEYRTDPGFLLDTVNRTKKGKNVYEISVPDSLAASLSLSVTDANEPFDSTSNILSQLLLSSEIKGKILHPAYYFCSQDDSVAAHLDLVMLTNGWRRFAWNDVLAGKSPSLPFKAETSYITLTGTISNIKDAKLKKAEIMNLLLTPLDGPSQFVSVPLEPGGNFALDDLVLYDTSEIFYRPNNIKLPGKAGIDINNSLDEVKPANSIQPLTNDTLFRASVYAPDTTGTARLRAILLEQEKAQKLKLQTTLQEVIVTTSRKNILNERHAEQQVFKDTSRAYSLNVLDDSTATSYPSLTEYLKRQKIPGTLIKFTPPGLTPIRPGLGAVTDGQLVERVYWADGSEMPIYINEHLTDPADVAKYSMDQIAFVKIFPPPFFGPDGQNWNGGGVAVYLLKGKDFQDIKRRIPSKLGNRMVIGYSSVKEFYQPTEAENAANVRVTDVRRTLLWKPNIETGAGTGRIRFSFINNDIAKSFRVVLEGMSMDGKLINMVKVF